MSHKPKNKLVFISLFLVMGWVPFESNGQTIKEYASLPPSSGRNSATLVLGLFGSYSSTSNDNRALVSNVPRAGDGDESTFATLRASNLTLPLVGQISGEAWVQMKFPSNRPAHTTAYVRLDRPTVTGISVDLIATVGGLLGLLDRQVIIPEAYQNATSQSNGDLLSPSVVNSNFMVDHQGNLYLAVTPSVSYNAIRIKLRNQGSLIGVQLGSNFHLNVYDTFTVAETDCDFRGFTASETVGGTVGAAGVSWPQRAIDNNPDTHSSLSVGLLDVGGTVSQFFDFVKLSDPTDEVHLTLSGNSSILNLNLLSGIRILAYNGADEIYNSTVGHINTELLDLLELDLLGLLANGDRVTIPIQPGTAFDRVEVRVGSLLGVSTSAALNIHEVKKGPGRAEVGSPDDMSVEICPGEDVSFILNNDLPDSRIYRWYEQSIGGNYIATSKPGEAFVRTEVHETTHYYVSVFDICLGESPRIPMSVYVREVLDFTVTPEGAAHLDDHGNYVYYEGQNPVVLVPETSYAETPDEGTFTWYKMYGPERERKQIMDGMRDDDGTTYRVGPGGVLTIENWGYREPGDAHRFLLVYISKDGCLKEKEFTFETLGITLPNSFLTFDARLTDRFGVEISWKARVQQGYLAVERAASGFVFEQILKVPAEWVDGDYSILDEAPMKGDSYYRLVIKSPDGSLIYTSELRRVHVPRELNTEALIYPNPFQNRINVSLSTFLGDLSEFHLINPQGKVLLSGPIPFSAQNRLFVLEDLEKYPSGIYIMQLTNGSKRFFFRLVKR